VGVVSSENGDLGVTLNKTLAWTIGTGLIAAGLYAGLNMATLTTRLDEVSTNATIATLDRSQIEVRVRLLENAQSQSTARFESLFQSLQELKSDQRESNRLLREILQGRDAN
jgi:hypothetical protein